MSLGVSLINFGSECSHCREGSCQEYVFDYNITHNLNSMASESGLYEAA